MLLLPFWGRRTTKGWRGPWPGEISPGRPPSRLRRTPPRGGKGSTGASPPPLGEGDPEGVEGATPHDLQALARSPTPSSRRPCKGAACHASPGRPPSRPSAVLPPEGGETRFAKEGGSAFLPATPPA